MLPLRGVVAGMALAAGQASAGAQTAPCSPACADGVSCVPAGCGAPDLTPLALRPPAADGDVLQGSPRAAPGSRRRLFQLLPYIGFHSYQGEGGTNLGPGLRVGGLTGFRLGDLVSLNAELSFDLLRATDLPAGDHYSEIDLTASFSPLVSFPAGRVELAFGPKLGAWLGSYHQTSLVRGDGGGTYSGLDLGANGAVFVQVGRKLWLGGLASFDVRTYRTSCFTPFRGTEGCTSSTLPSSDKVVALSALLMFSV